MPHKPMKLRNYQRWILQYGWSLIKGGMDWKLLNEQGGIEVLNILIPHPPGNEVAPISVKKTKQALQDRGLTP